MANIYCLNGENLSLGTGNVLAVIQTNSGVLAGSMIRLLRLEIGQSGSTTSGQVRGSIFTRDTAGTLTVTSATPRPLSPVGGVASGIAGNTAPLGAVARCGVNSSADSGGTYTDLIPFNFNNLNGYLWVPTPEERVLVCASTVIGVRLIASPATTTGWTVALTFEEVS